jgi:hypothetical protein
VQRSVVCRKATYREKLENREAKRSEEKRRDVERLMR